ncbi:13808_t:CDS:2 [Ambispora leptoticha]|uniref:13808_t:CDS:1 n=1 Tax=Ambispora leptoticha TaxID=144679 RepID=A0A9N9D3Z2_9GLOM|nr:13808_t:CDS:2 [Ambispora leptoticha]
MKEGVIKLGTLGAFHKKQRIIKSALNGKTYAYYQQNQSNNQTPGLMQTLLNATLPALLQHFTGGQPMPAGGNNNSNSPEVQLMLTQVLAQQQLIINNQQDLTSRIVNLETRASQQFTGLAKQVQNLSSVRLTPERERKPIDFNQNSDNYGN